MYVGLMLGSRNTTVKQMGIPCLHRTCVFLVDTDKEVVEYNTGY